MTSQLAIFELQVSRYRPQLSDIAVFAECYGMKVALEYLYHFHCDRCRAWWSQADIEPQEGDRLYCPHCGEVNVIETIQTFKNSVRNNCLKVVPDKA